MSGTSAQALSVTGLFAERDARRRHDQEALEQLQRRKEEEIAEYRQRLDNFQLTDAIIQSGLDRIKRTFERGETELMFSSFPSSFCTDGGRAIINAGVPPINKPTREELAARIALAIGRHREHLVAGSDVVALPDLDRLADWEARSNLSGVRRRQRVAPAHSARSA